MKQSRQCPKCAGKKLWWIERFSAKELRVTPGAQPLMLAIYRKTLPTHKPKGWLKDDGSRSYDAGSVDAWVCASCGYTEMWSSGMEDLVANPKSGVHLLDGTDSQ